MFKHGHYRYGKGTSTYNSWTAMKSRCLNPQNLRFSDYGGRGITICDRWLDFRNFLEDMGERPKGLTLDRKDNNKGYEPDNCRWATWAEQLANRKTYTSKNQNSNKTHCLRGHALFGNNLYKYSNGQRMCKECNRIADRRAYKKKVWRSLHAHAQAA